MYCPRCGGIISEKQTKVLHGDVPYHFYCSFKIFEEQKEARLKELENAAKVRQDKWTPNLLRPK
jgi:DNA-directed RNA polymerase subunit RPC12/RpoP